MSELINEKAVRSDFRGQLLATVSALALTALAFAICDADAAEAGPLSFWIELGGQFDQLNAGQQPWSPPSTTFGSLTSPPITTPPPTSVGVVPHVGFDVDGKISYQPDGSDWILSLAARFGRASRGPKVTQDQNQDYGKYGYPNSRVFVATRAEATDRHAILDFSAGKDFGLGMGAGSRSIVNFGVRIAQFNSRLNAHMNSLHPTSVPTPSGGNGADNFGHYASGQPNGNADIRHSFTGAGPSVAWDASVPVLGRPENGLSFDWSANGAILFGRQKTVAHVATNDVAVFYSAAVYHACHCGDVIRTKVVRQSDVTVVRSRQAFVPNIGGLLGISYRKSDLKLSFGYRADFFLSAIDGGADSRKTYNRGFFGPFASVSVGLGG